MLKWDLLALEAKVAVRIKISLSFTTTTSPAMRSLCWIISRSRALQFLAGAMAPLQELIWP